MGQKKLEIRVFLRKVHGSEELRYRDNRKESLNCESDSYQTTQELAQGIFSTFKEIFEADPNSIRVRTIKRAAIFFFQDNFPPPYCYGEYPLDNILMMEVQDVLEKLFRESKPESIEAEESPGVV